MSNVIVVPVYIVHVEPSINVLSVAYHYSEKTLESVSHAATCCLGGVLENVDHTEHINVHCNGHSLGAKQYRSTSFGLA